MLFLVVASNLKAQQIPQYSQWFWNLLALNPAHSGIKPCQEIKAVYRNQWANLNGSPNTGLLTFSTPIYVLRKRIYTPRQGAGFKIESEKIGPFTMNRFNLSYAGHFNFSPDKRLSVGIAVGVRQWIFDKTKVTTLTPDPVIPESNSFVSPDASAGFWWNDKNYFLSLSFMELTASRWKNISNDSRFHFHTFFSAGYRKAINDKLTFLPFVLFRIPPKGPVSMDINAVFDYKNRIALGFGLRNTDAVNVVLQLKIKENFVLAYSFDYVVSNLSNNQFFTHEFSFAFGTCKQKIMGKTICPLF